MNARPNVFVNGRKVSEEWGEYWDVRVIDIRFGDYRVYAKRMIPYNLNTWSVMYTGAGKFRTNNSLYFGSIEQKVKSIAIDLGFELQQRIEEVV